MSYQLTIEPLGQTLLVEDGLIRRIYTLRNPDKLTRVLLPPA